MNDGIRTLTEQDINTLSTTKQVQYGATGMTEDGRKYRYVSFGGTSTINPGDVVVAAAVTANLQGMTITATTVAAGFPNTSSTLALGSTQLTISNTTSTTATQDQFAEGFLEVMVGGATGTSTYSYRIRGNTPVTAGNVTTSYFTVFLAEPLRNTTALVPGTDTVNLVPSPYNGVAPSATANLPVGVTVMPVPNTSTVTNYGWVQTAGPCNVQNDAGGTITVGGGFAQSVTTAGAVVASTASAAPIIGYTRKAITASNDGPAFLNIN